MNLHCERAEEKFKLKNIFHIPAMRPLQCGTLSTWNFLHLLLTFEMKSRGKFT